MLQLKMNVCVVIVHLAELTNKNYLLNVMLATLFILDTYKGLTKCAGFICFIAHFSFFTQHG